MKSYRYKFYSLIILLVLFLTSTTRVFAQCAMCRATVENNVSGGETSLAAGLNTGILYLFITPYLIIGVIAFLWYKQSKANARKISLASRNRSKMS